MSSVSGENPTCFTPKWEIPNIHLFTYGRSFAPALVIQPPEFRASTELFDLEATKWVTFKACNVTWDGNFFVSLYSHSVGVQLDLKSTVFSLLWFNLMAPIIYLGFYPIMTFKKSSCRCFSLFSVLSCGCFPSYLIATLCINTSRMKSCIGVSFIVTTLTMGVGQILLIETCDDFL